LTNQRSLAQILEGARRRAGPKHGHGEIRRENQTGGYDPTVGDKSTIKVENPAQKKKEEERIVTTGKYFYSRKIKKEPVIKRRSKKKNEPGLGRDLEDWGDNAKRQDKCVCLRNRKR